MLVPVRYAVALIATCSAALLLFGAVATAHADLGDRILQQGSRGPDVKALQRLLSRAGFASKADGVFGTGTRRAVVRLERELEMRPDGRVTSGDVRLIETALQPAKSPGGFSYTSEEEAKARPRAVSAQQAAGSKAELTQDGLAIPPADAPDQVKKVIAAANEIAHTPYKYGGGHGKWDDSGYDCSGSVSFALHGGGLLEESMPSGGFMDWGDNGPGQWITVYANGGHAYMVVAGLRFDTSGRAKTGSRWQRDDRSSSGFSVRHPEGF
jgi:peptidoglycan hydrolase-like protein with peptidoglycan-binding domain